MRLRERKTKRLAFLNGPLGRRSSYATDEQMAGHYEGAVCEVSRNLYNCTNTVSNACKYICAGGAVEPLA